MLSLNLQITPSQQRLERNAAPHLRAILSTLGEIDDAASTFRGTNDTRPLIQKVIAKLNERIFAKMTAVRDGFKRGDLNETMRESAAVEVLAVRGLINDALAIADSIDRWMPDMMLAACNQLVILLRQPIPKSAEKVPEARPVNVQRRRLHERAMELTGFIRPLGWTVHGGRSHVEPILAKAEALTALLFGERHQPLDLTRVREEATSIQVDLQALDRVRSQLGGEVRFPFFKEETPYALKCVADLLKEINPSRLPR